LSFKLPVEEAEKFIDLVFSNTDTAIVKLTPAGVTARNLNTARTAAYSLEAPIGWFYMYRVDAELFLEISDRKACKTLVRAAKAAGKTDIEFRVSGNDFLLEDSKIGVTDRQRMDFECPELKIELPNRISGWTDFAPMLKRWISSVRKGGADAIGIACKEPESVPPVKAPKAVTVKAFNEEVQMELTPPSIELLEPKFGSAYALTLVESFIPVSVWLRKPYPYVTILGAKGYYMPLGIDLELGVLKFRAYIAPNMDYTTTLLRRLNLLKPLTKNDILIAIRDYWLAHETPVEPYELESTLQKDGFEIGRLHEILKQLAEEKKLTVREAGWRRYYSPIEAPVKLKPLTEDIVLSKIRGLCLEWNTDAVGYTELEAVLAREYQILPLHDILLRLKTKGLVETKPWPAKRPGGYAVDMRGYWAIKETEPEEAVKQAEEKPLKPLTKEVVLSTLKDTNMEVKTRVSFDDLAGILADEGYDVTKLGDMLAELRTEEKVSVDLAGKWFVKDIEEKIRRLHTSELWLEKIKTVGVRDPRDPTKFLPPEHPLSMLEARKVEADIRLLKEEITDEDYRREIQEIDTEMEKVRREFEVPSPVAEIPPPPPVPPGYAKVRFLRDMVRFIGTDRKVYGPFRTHEEAVIPAQHAEIFEKHRYVEIKQGSVSTHSLANPQKLFTDQEKQPISLEYKLLEYGVLE